MVKKLFALASVTALTGLVAAVSAAGCSSTTYVYADAGAADARRDGTRPPDTEESDAPTCKAQGVFEPEDLKNPAPRQASACDTAKIAAIAAKCASNDADANGAECKAARDLAGNKTCADCIFGTDADAQWKVVNLQPAAERPVRYNQAGCIEHVSGVAGCGESLLTLNICLTAYCTQCTTDADERACVEDVINAECAGFKLTQACGTAAFDTKETEVGDCFSKREDPDDTRLFVYMATVACASTGSTKDGGDGGDGG